MKFWSLKNLVNYWCKQEMAQTKDSWKNAGSAIDKSNMLLNEPSREFLVNFLSKCLTAIELEKNQNYIIKGSYLKYRKRIRVVAHKRNGHIGSI